MAKYKVGDKVRIVSERPDSRSYVDEMVRFLGKEITISMVEEFRGIPYYYSEDAKPKDPIQEHFCKWFGVPGYFFVDEWISGLAEQKKPEFSVSVRFHGRLTVAELIKDGKVVKVENARCNLSDKYSMAEGARIAVERLFEKKRKEDKPKESKPKVGDKFVVVSNPSHYCSSVGKIVTLYDILGSGKIYKDSNGALLLIRDCNVKPYKENSK